MNRLCYYFLILCFCPIGIVAQVNPGKIKDFILGSEGKNIPETVARFYKISAYEPVWFGYNQLSRTDSLFSMLQNAESNGLNAADYEPGLVFSAFKKNLPLFNLKDSVETEIRLTTIAIRFISDITYGNTPPGFSYDGLKYRPGCLDIDSLFVDCLHSNNWSGWIDTGISRLPEIKILAARIAFLKTILDNTDYREEMLSNLTVSTSNTYLLKKLSCLGIIDSAGEKLTNQQLKEKIREVQRQFDLLDDGTIRSTLLEALNVPLVTRLKQLKLAINYYRWLYCLSVNQPVAVVNIPAAYLKVYDHGKVIMEMRIIVGKPSTPTPTLTSMITEVILYPYWLVPRSIAIKELLPVIKRRPGYLDENSYQLISTEGKIINPYKVNWHNITAANFSYTIRQSTGCDNALGLLKLNFYNPFGVYLHDTPDKSLFMFNKRYFSHGCMRMENPMELGHLLLKNNSIAIDTLEQKGCLLNQSPITVLASEKIAVVVWYNLVGIDATGKAVYYEDVYKKSDYATRNSN